MKKFEKFTGLVAPLDRANVDTDAIIPKQYLKSIKRTGFGPTLFDDWRYLDPGEPGMDHSQRRINPEFVLNQARYHGAQILLARDNFGCGSSREHAPWALLGYGFRAVISTSFADIFRNNALKNGLLPIAVDKATHAELGDLLVEAPDAKLAIDLAAQTLTLPNGRAVSFPIDDFSKTCLLNGIDELGYLLAFEDKIAEYERRQLS
ncbi:MAG TPA: 3-isopropylmalate dehydratase small subunit [Acidiferrobacterales bacterium]|nr:3-isopropylmalate dehydratase small subunit [Acidiferrobacterales bacterium]